MQTVRIYFNLHKKLFSVQEKINGVWKVVAHKKDVLLSDVTFKISEAGRQRVLRERRKNVHGYVMGTEILSDAKIICDTLVRYNPYKNDSFVDERDNKIFSSKFARLGLVDKRPKICASL